MSNVGSWWWGSSSSAASSEFDRVLENCTSSNLPSSSPPPITESLTLSDLIRSSAVPSTYAVKSLRKRLLNSNPNVQLLTIAVIDICIKNGGDTFLKEIGTTKEFTEDCTQLITNSLTNREVKQKLLRDYQNWSIAFESVPFLSGSELVNNYRRLKSIIGIEFPPKDPSATSAMVDSMSAPEWRDNEVCERCRTVFSFTNRKHHCRNCGGIFDGQCSSKRRTLTHFGLTEPVRVCDGCDRTLNNHNHNNSNSKPTTIRRNSVSVDNPSSNKLLIPTSHHRSATLHSSAGLPTRRYTTNNEDADLERAIALSLQDSSQPVIISKSAPAEHSLLTQSPSKPFTDEENDPALAAAIAASLKEAGNANLPSAPPPITESARYRPLAPPKPPLPSYELTTEQTNAIYNFSSEVDTAIRTGTLNPTNPALNNAHSTVESVRPLVMRGIENADRKTQLLREMNDKLSEVVKTYDRLLSEQIMYRTQSTSQQTISLAPSVYAPSPSSVYNPAVVQQYSNFHPQVGIFL
ncbi:hypothetical protein CROQUDRAFT_52110 [Cronartium quercuum f. sp. fusiforme G11]|uniref:Vacuolar protein sorting-associated protein 27 n=1 Tax=Cronartium quercuum f. sp. fusiforme G11 TaxID=708437 RepID=A0A9P6NCF8_9BASI|nr:hypothetical protein CROQUDRAFT_54883 [Cronartium quercuum f. sp. fusiforme G11]KAG0141181.1 hypothetical protein CROQUDRAFT_52110 [Cronartium quercuum f. sp. fusiforme G11]